MSSCCAGSNTCFTRVGQVKSKKPNSVPVKQTSLDSSLSSSTSSTSSTSITSSSKSSKICFRCFSCFNLCTKSSAKDQRETIKLLLLGLDNAGKTTVALHLTGESVDDVVSTIGFSKFEVKLKHMHRKKLVLYDLGGGKRIRSIWKNYYSLVHGIIFVIDSADIERILEVKQLLSDIVSDEKVAGKPILIYLNKQDLYEAMDEIDVCKFTNLEEIVSKHQCITKIESIAARNVVETGMVDSTVEASFRWLVNFIEDNWIELNSRVEANSQQQIRRENDSIRRKINKINQRNMIEIESKVPPGSKHTVVEEQPKSNTLPSGDYVNEKDDSITLVYEQTEVENIKAVDNHGRNNSHRLEIISSFDEDQTMDDTEVEEIGANSRQVDSRGSGAKRTNKVHPK